MRIAVRALIAVTALSLVATGCSGGGGASKDIKEVGEKYTKMDAGDVKPPAGPDTQRQSLPGFIVTSNSPSWQGLVHSPKGPGAVVLFIQPGGPTDGKGIARGDLLVGVDDDTIANAERAVSVLHSRIGEKRTLRFKRVGRKDEREVKISGRTPRANARAVLSAQVKNNPTDPTLRYLRAYVGGTTKERLEDLAAALEQKPDFVDALQLRASLLWSAAFGQKDAKAKRDVQTQALAGWKNALDVDPRNVATLAVRSIAYADLGTPKLGESDAKRALRLDGTQPLALFALSRAYLAENHPQQAAGPGLGAVELMPYNLDYWKNLATIFVKLKRKDDCTKTANAFGPYLRARKGDAFRKAADDLRKICS